MCVLLAKKTRYSRISIPLDKTIVSTYCSCLREIVYLYEKKKEKETTYIFPNLPTIFCIMSNSFIIKIIVYNQNARE